MCADQTCQKLPLLLMHTPPASCPRSAEVMQATTKNSRAGLSEMLCCRELWIRLSCCLHACQPPGEVQPLPCTGSYLCCAVALDEVGVNHPCHNQAKDGLRAVYGVATSQRDAGLPADVHPTV